MKKLLVLFLALVVIAGAGLGFSATSTPNPSDSGNITNNLGQNDRNNSTNFDQNDGDTGNIGRNDDQDEDNGQDENWYDGFWNNKNKDHDEFWKDKDHKGFWKDKDKKDKDDDDDHFSEIEINNYVTAEANGGNAESNVGIEESNVGNAESNVGIEEPARILSTGGETEFIDETEEETVSMQETAIPILPALFSTLMIGGGLLYARLRK